MGRELRREIRRLRVQLEFVPTRPKLLRWLPGYWTRGVVICLRPVMLVTWIAFYLLFYRDQQWWLALLWCLGVSLAAGLLFAAVADLARRPFLGRYLLQVMVGGTFCDFERPWTSVRGSEPKLAVDYLRYICEEATAHHLRLKLWGANRFDPGIRAAFQARYREARELEQEILFFLERWEPYMAAELNRVLADKVCLGNALYVAEQNRYREAELLVRERGLGKAFEAGSGSQTQPAQVVNSLVVQIIEAIRNSVSDAAKR